MTPAQEAFVSASTTAQSPHDQAVAQADSTQQTADATALQTETLAIATSRYTLVTTQANAQQTHDTSVASIDTTYGQAVAAADQQRDTAYGSADQTFTQDMGQADFDYGSSMATAQYANAQSIATAYQNQADQQAAATLTQNQDQDLAAATRDQSLANALLTSQITQSNAGKTQSIAQTNAIANFETQNATFTLAWVQAAAAADGTHTVAVQQAEWTQWVSQAQATMARNVAQRNFGVQTPTVANPSAFSGVPTPNLWESYFSSIDNALQKFSTGGVDTIAKWLAHPISSFNEWYVDGTLFFNANDPHIAQLEASGALRQAVDNKGNAMSGYYLLFVEDQVMVLTVAGGDYFLIGTQKYLPNYSDQAIVGGYQINQSQRWLAWAEAGLTVALHLVPLGGTADLLAQGKVAEAANSALVDALTVIPGLNLCKAPALIRRGVQAVKVYNMVSSGIQAATAVTNIIAELCSGGQLDIVTVIGEGRKAFVALTNLRRTAQIQTSCFGAGTPLRTLTGHKLIEEVCVGDVLLSRSEKDLDGPLAGKVVEQIFVRTGEIWHLHVGSEVIRTTAEHPFWVKEKGWVATNELQQGDLLASQDGQWILVEEVFNTGIWERVYNLRIGEFQTYFVGSGNWTFCVWAHNDSCDSKILGNALRKAGQNRPTSKHQAAHLVPTGNFSKRPANVQKAIEDARAAIQPIGINTAANGFWALRGHKGTHRNKYFLEIGKTLKEAEAVGPKAVRDALKTIKNNAMKGVYRGNKYRRR